MGVQSAAAGRMRVSLATPVKAVAPGGGNRSLSRPIKGPLLRVAREVTRDRLGSEDAHGFGRVPLVQVSRSSVLDEVKSRVAESTPHPAWVAVPITQCPGTGKGHSVCAYQSIGDRKTQEDRYTIVPCLDPTLDVPNSFFGVFDGTVGDFASNSVKDLVVPKLLESPSWKAFRQAYGGLKTADEERLLTEAFRDMYRWADEALLAHCARHTQHYATCTSVTVLIVGDLLVVGHLGDSRIILAKEEEGRAGELSGEQLTMDHKPDLDGERRRIEQCGGLVVRLRNHGNKPFIRGGDFMMRKGLGEQPMQLQYSRAFGAKDLKVFGMSSQPDVRVIRMGHSPYKSVRSLVLASDGLWDVISTQEAVRIFQEAAAKSEHPAEALVTAALREQAKAGGRADNITAVTVQFDQH